MDHELLAPDRTRLLVLAVDMAASLTRTVSFRAMHRYYRPDWSEARNREAFGALTDPPGHEHDYSCAATVSGALNEDDMIVDLGLVDRILDQEVIRPFAGKHLNLDVPAFAYGKTLPTCEAIAAYIFPRIAARLPAGVKLKRVRIAEDPTLYADCTGVD
jgi:6-pyruvoyltetrahydropterin/6-carboxytetrahydropterin synthase